MISVESTVQINAVGEDVTLNRDDVWRGLELKAENALPFVPAMTVCEVKARGKNFIKREIEFRGQRSGENITLVPGHSVQFDRTFGAVMGTIRNDIMEDDDGNLQLKFSFNLELDGVEAGSEEEQDYEHTMSKDYLKAAGATLAATRRMVAEERHED